MKADKDEKRKNKKIQSSDESKDEENDKEVKKQELTEKLADDIVQKRIALLKHKSYEEALIKEKEKRSRSSGESDDDEKVKAPKKRKEDDLENKPESQVTIEKDQGQENIISKKKANPMDVSAAQLQAIKTN
jgi:hypothetical protein